MITITHDIPEFVADNFQRVVAMAHKHIIADGTPRDIFLPEMRSLKKVKSRGHRWELLEMNSDLERAS